MSLSELLIAKPSATVLQQWLHKVPYAVTLGMEARVVEDDILFVLPPNEKLIGNSSIPAIHGGIVGAFMEQAAAFNLIAKMSEPTLPKIINFSLDYLRAVRLENTFARCEVTRQGRKIGNVCITAWQSDENKPCSVARAHFLLPEPLEDVQGQT